MVTQSNSIFSAVGSITETKTVVLPQSYSDNQNISFKVIFPNGHNDASSVGMLTLNSIAVVVNKNGLLVPIPHHAMTENDATVYKVLQPNTVLELYYTTNYDRQGTPAFVIIGNPVVLSSADYTIYADGFKVESPIDSIVNGNMRPATSNAVYLQQKNSNVVVLEANSISGITVTTVSEGSRAIRVGNLCYFCISFDLTGTYTGQSAWTEVLKKPTNLLKPGEYFYIPWLMNIPTNVGGYREIGGISSVHMGYGETFNHMMFRYTLVVPIVT